MMKLPSIIALVAVSLLPALHGLLESSVLDALDSTALALEVERSGVDFTAKVVPVVPFGSKGAVIPFSKRVSGKRLKGGWGARRRSYKKRPASRKVPVKKTRVSKNKNLQAMNQIQNGMLEASAMRQGLNTALVQRLIKQSCNAGYYLFARQMLGHNLYNLQKSKGERRAKRSALSARQILNSVKAEIGNDNYHHLLAYNGGVTLGFVVDTTGSMGDEMMQAKKLARGIVMYDRLSQVDYALSPFNDPITHAYHGPVSYKNYEEREGFLTLLANLKASGGGDCKEMTIHGIQNLFNAPIWPSSPVYVFTDAGAKDATAEEVEALKDMVGMVSARLNFFLSSNGCLKPADFKFYENLAADTGGQVLYFSSSSTIASMKSLVQNSLIGGSSIPVIKTQRIKRSIGFVDYSITVDNTVDTLSTTVMTSSSSSQALLYSPSGTLQVGQKTGGGSTLFSINKPASGVWRLSVPGTSSNNFVAANCISFENIDFESNFLVDVKIRGKAKSVASKFPIKGKTATVVITIPAHKRTQTSSLKLRVVNNVFQPSSTVPLKQYGRSAGRFIASFTTPRHDFKLIVEGKTRENTRFERLGSGLIKPRTVFFHILSAPRGFVVYKGSSRKAILLFALHNFGTRETFRVKLNELEKSAARVPNRVFGVPGRMSFFMIPFTAPKGSKKNGVHNVVITVIGNITGAKASKSIQLFVM